MIFSELYSAYYNAVARILKTAFTKDITEAELIRTVADNAFSESILTILPSLKSGRWPLLKNGKPVTEHIPTMPLTDLEKRWLRSLTDDPRIKLFDVSFPELEGVEPLFTREDYKVYDQYSDGDPFEDERYIKNFRVIYDAIKGSLPVSVTLTNRNEKRVGVRFRPIGFEYSLKDDKIRVIANGCKYRQFNLGRIVDCRIFTKDAPWNDTPDEEVKKELVLRITDERNAMERAMLHFAHFEKQAEKLCDDEYLLRLKYYKSDETEMVIRVLSFGPFIKVEEPEEFRDLIIDRLKRQKSCGLK